MLANWLINQVEKRVTGCEPSAGSTTEGRPGVEWLTSKSLRVRPLQRARFVKLECLAECGRDAPTYGESGWYRGAQSVPGWIGFFVCQVRIGGVLPGKVDLTWEVK